MKEIQSTSIRLDEALIQRIRADAKKEKRSITAQIEYMLEKYYEVMDSFTKPTHHQQNRDAM